MANEKNSQSLNSNQKGYDNLYVALFDPEEKRKNILFSIKHSLIIQEEHEKVLEIRKEKSRVLNEIKSEMESLNSTYQKLRKFLPNVKNVISHTEKELNTLEDNIEMFKNEIDVAKNSIKLDEQIQSKLKSKSSEKETLLSKDSFDVDKEEPSEIPKQIKTKSSKMSRLDRIQNNLKVIESKLNKV